MKRTRSSSAVSFSPRRGVLCILVVVLIIAIAFAPTARAQSLNELGGNVTLGPDDTTPSPADATPDPSAPTTDAPTGSNNETTTAAPTTEIPSNQTTNATETPQPTTEAPPTNDTTPAPSTIVPATNAPAGDVQSTTSKSLPMPDDTNRTKTKSVEAESQNVTEAPTVMRTRTITYVQPPEPTNATPVPSLSGEDRINRDYEFSAVAIFNIPLTEFTMNIDQFTSTYIIPAMPEDLKMYAASIILLNYCSVSKEDATEDNLRRLGCGSYSKVETPYTWINFAFFGSTGKTNYTNLNLPNLPLVTVNDGANYLFAVVENVKPVPTDPPGLASMAAENATTPFGFLLIMLVMSVTVCLCIVLVKKFRTGKQGASGEKENDGAGSRSDNYATVGPGSNTSPAANSDFSRTPPSAAGASPTTSAPPAAAPALSRPQPVQPAPQPVQQVASSAAPIEPQVRAPSVPKPGQDNLQPVEMQPVQVQEQPASPQQREASDVALGGGGGDYAPPPVSHTAVVVDTAPQPAPVPAPHTGDAQVDQIDY